MIRTERNDGGHRVKLLSGGILPALVTPLNPDKSVNVQSLEALVHRVFEARVDGIYVCGSTGEGLLLSEEARKLVTEVVVKCAPVNKQVIAHIGGNTLETTLSLAQHASKLGVTAVSSLPLPGMPASALREFYRAIADNSEVPVVAYYFPAQTGGELTFEALCAVADVPGVEAIKFTDYDLYKLSRLAERGLIVFNGRDEVLAAGLLMGASGGIGSIYNLVPHWFVDLYRAASSGDWQRARSLQQEINQLITVLLQYPLIAALKETLSSMGLDCGPALTPPYTLTTEQKDRLQKQLKAFADRLVA
jgi:N-acetylneuraminate lyase